MRTAVARICSTRVPTSTTSTSARTVATSRSDQSSGSSYPELMSLTGLDGDDQLAKQMDPTQWPALKVSITEPFKTRDA